MNNPRIPRKPGQPANSRKHSDLYTDENPKGTIRGLGFKDVSTAKQSVSKIKDSGKTHAHKIQAAIAMEQRAKVMGKSSEAAVFRSFINSMKEKTKKMNEESESKKCKSGYYYCNTNKECKPLPSGFNTPGQTIKPTEVGIGVPVEGSCNHTKKGKICPKHGMKDCTLIGETLNSVREEGIRAWFRSKSEDDVPGWVDVVTGDSCASDKPGEGITKCVSSSKRSSMTPAERRSAKARKRAADPGQQQKTGAAKPTYVPTDSPTKKMKEEFFKENHKEIADGREKDEEGYMASTEMDTIDSAVKKLRKNIKKGDMQLPAWVQSKITKAADYIDTAADYLDSEEMSEESDKKGKGSGTKDACYTKVKSRYSVWPSAYASGALVRCRKVGAANWGNKTESYPTIAERILGEMQEAKKLGFEIKPSRGVGALTLDAAKQLGDKAVALQKKKAAAVALPKIKKEETLVDKLTNEILDEKCWTGYKKKGMKTMFGKKYPNCVKVEDVTIEDAEGNTFAEVVDIIKSEPIKGFKSQIEEVVRLQAQTGNVIAVTLSWRAKYYSIKMFFPQVKLPTRKEINTELQKVYPGCNVIHHSVSEIQPGQPLIQAFGPQGGSAAKPGSSKKYVKPYGEQVEVDDELIEESAAWQRKEGKNPEGGLNAKGVASYRRENSGSKLQTAVTTEPSKLKPGSKAAKRRKSFCARMGGMPGPMKDEKGRPTRKALSLRKWNC